MKQLCLLYNIYFHYITINFHYITCYGTKQVMNFHAMACEAHAQPIMVLCAFVNRDVNNNSIENWFNSFFWVCIDRRLLFMRQSIILRTITMCTYQDDYMEALKKHNKLRYNMSYAIEIDPIATCKGEVYLAPPLSDLRQHINTKMRLAASTRGRENCITIIPSHQHSTDGSEVEKYSDILDIYDFYILIFLECLCQGLSDPRCHTKCSRKLQSWRR